MKEMVHEFQVIEEGKHDFSPTPIKVNPHRRDFSNPWASPLIALNNGLGAGNGSGGKNTNKQHNEEEQFNPYGT